MKPETLSEILLGMKVADGCGATLGDFLACGPHMRIGVYDLVSAFGLLSGIVGRLDPGYQASGWTLGDKVQDLAQRLECLVIEARRK